jgi:XTP/dITP diphosphohydrolase
VILQSTGRVVLVETSGVLPGLLPFQAWDALATADIVLVRDAAAHPAVPHLHLAGLDVADLEPVQLERDDLLLTRPGGPDDRRLAKALVRAAERDGQVVYLLDDDERGIAPALAGMVAEHDIEIELVLLAQLPRGTELLRAVAVMDRLRDPESGCPWDLEQDHASLARYLVEETYELLDAVSSGVDGDMREELGDVLLQVLFHARIAAERRAFGIDDVAAALVEKLVRRHPHVFAPDGPEVVDAADVQRTWDRLKSDEKGGRGPLDGIPVAMPGLALLDALLRRVDRLGMMPETTSEVHADLLAALNDPALMGPGDAAADVAARADAHADADEGEAADAGSDVSARAVGQLLVLVAGLARRLGVEADAAARTAAGLLRDAVDETVHGAKGRGIDPAGLERLERLVAWPGRSSAAG